MKNLDNENIIHIVKNDIEILQFRELLKFPNLIHGYTLKKHGFSIGRTHEQVLKNSYEKISKFFEIDESSIVQPYQSHTDNVEIVNSKIDNLKDVDGVITDKQNILLATTTADCIALLFFDKSTNIIANVHSGWRGTVKKIGKKAVEKMITVYGLKPENIICCICPSIRKCHFEVDEDVMGIFKNEFEYTGRITEIISKGDIKNGKQKYFVDTVLINKIMLQEAGLKAENIIDSGICTVCHSDEFHSHRGNGIQAGRNGAFIGMC